MIEHYNAFISYKHAPEDIIVAESIQRELEHFHVPSKIRKKSGMKKIDRVFRDKDELPITSDLSNDISYALEHADYLIVICSTNTRESIWVSREIDYFLKNHSRRQILTVLVNGEPQDVIPEILLSEERIVNNDKGEPQTIRVSLEPLSCDYRMPIKQATREELPRLAAALLGCSYDELMNRHRQYKMQRLSVVFAGILCIALAFGGYMLYSRNQIKANYQESLRNQSRYLANESKQLLENEQRITALLLALYALPQKDERPVTSEAMRALTDATLSYVSLSGNNIYAAWNYQMPNQIKDYLVSPEGTSLAALDSGNLIYIWNTGTHEPILTLQNTSDKIYGIAYLTDDRFLFWTSGKICMYDLDSASMLWESVLEDDSYRSDTVAITSDGNFMIRGNTNIIYKYAAADGTILQQIPLPEKKEDEVLSMIDWTLSPSEDDIAFTSFIGQMQYIAGVYHMKTGQTVYTEITDHFIRDLYWADDSHLLIAASLDDGKTNAASYNYSFLSTDHTYIQCFDPSDLSLCWDYDFTSNEVMLDSDFLYLPANNYVAYYCGNIVDIYDLATGECYYHHNLNDSIVDISDRDGDGWPLYITQNGGMAVPMPSSGSDQVSMVKHFTDNLRDAEINQGVYAHTFSGREIIYYGLYISDKEWIEYDDNIVLASTGSDYYLDDSVLAILTEEDTGITLTFYDPDTNSLIRQVIIGNPDMGAYNYTLLGCNNGTCYLSHNEYPDLNLISVDIAGGEIEERVIPDVYTISSNSVNYQEGKLIYITCPEIGTYILSVYDVVTDETTEYPIPDTAMTPVIKPQYYPDGNCIYYADSSCDYLLRLDSGDFITIPHIEDWNGTEYVIIHPEDKDLFAVTDGSKILLIRRDGTVQTEIGCSGPEPMGLHFCDSDRDGKTDTLLVPYDSGDLYRYSVKDGAFIGKSDLSIYLNASYAAEFSYDTAKDLLYIQIGRITDVIDMDSWIEVACVENCFGHYAPTDHFITTSYTASSEVHVGYFRHYTLDELKNKGWEILQDTDLTIEQKSGYGIE